MTRCLSRSTNAIARELARLYDLGLPPAGAVAAAVEIDAWSRPVRRIGGDVLAVWPIDDRRVVVFLGDVMGHGTPAAVVGSAVRAALHQIRRTGARRPAALLARLNALVCDLFPEYFVTATACLVDVAAGTLTVAQAGHPAVLVRRGLHVEAIALRALPLGLVPGSEYEERTIDFPTGAAALLYSDGVLDSLAEPGRSGRETLEALLHPRLRVDAGRLVRRVRRAIRAVGRPPEDDCSLLAVRRLT